MLEEDYSNDNFVPIESIVKNMEFLEQFVKSVINYSSKYNNSFSINYAPENLVGKYSKYPDYGDFTETYILRSYGKWWKTNETLYNIQDTDPYSAEDFVTLSFQTAVIPRIVFIYETFNPGAIVRIWGRLSEKNWILLWEGPPEYCPKASRKFNPPIKKINCLINELRLEINQSHLKYYTSIDAVLLCGYQPQKIICSLLKNNLNYWIKSISNCDVEEDSKINDSCDYFSNLPHEVIVQIFQYLDLKSLSRCAQVNKTWYEVTFESSLYQNLNLKHYWNHFDSNLLIYLMKRCEIFKKINLDWCCSDNNTTFMRILHEFIHKSWNNITYLSVNHCDFTTNSFLNSISSHCLDLKVINLRSSKADYFYYLATFKKLVSLDLYCTKINDDDLILILQSNPHMRHLNLDFCENLNKLDTIVETVSIYNKNLISWSSWKTRSLTTIGVNYFSKLTQLNELDLGWCLMLLYPGNCLEKITLNCKLLEKLIISQWRGINDQLLLPIINNCKNLVQLDLLGIKVISNEICERILISLPKLKLLDISFCDSISDDKVDIWRQQFPQVTIQRSCQYMFMEYLN